MAKPERERNITGKCKKRTRLLLLGQRPSAIMKKNVEEEEDEHVSHKLETFIRSQ